MTLTPGERLRARRRAAELTATPSPTADPSAVGDGVDPDNPGASTVAAVLDHLAKHPDDRDRVLAAEAAGKARAGILGGS